jgi:hypothetical protein
MISIMKLLGIPPGIPGIPLVSKFYPRNDAQASTAQGNQYNYIKF